MVVLVLAAGAGAGAAVSVCRCSVAAAFAAAAVAAFTAGCLLLCLVAAAGGTGGAGGAAVAARVDWAQCWLLLQRLRSFDPIGALPRDGVACARLRRIGIQWGLCRLLST